MIPETSVDPNEFPLPFAVSGVKPKMGTEPPTTQTPATNFVKPRDSADTHHGGAAPAATAASTPVRKKSDSSQMNNTAAKAEGDPKSSTSDTSDPADTDPERKKSRKPIKIDPAILQRPSSRGTRTVSRWYRHELEESLPRRGELLPTQPDSTLAKGWPVLDFEAAKFMNYQGRNDFLNSEGRTLHL